MKFIGFKKLSGFVCALFLLAGCGLEPWDWTGVHGKKKDDSTEDSDGFSDETSPGVWSDSPAQASAAPNECAYIPNVDFTIDGVDQKADIFIEKFKHEKDANQPYRITMFRFYEDNGGRHWWVYHGLHDRKLDGSYTGIKHPRGNYSSNFYVPSTASTYEDLMVRAVGFIQDWPVYRSHHPSSCNASENLAKVQNDFKSEFLVNEIKCHKYWADRQFDNSSQIEDYYLKLSLPNSSEIIYKQTDEPKGKNIQNISRIDFSSFDVARFYGQTIGAVNQDEDMTLKLGRFEPVDCTEFDAAKSRLSF